MAMRYAGIVKMTVLLENVVQDMWCEGSHISDVRAKALWSCSVKVNSYFWSPWVVCCQQYKVQFSEWSKTSEVQIMHES